MIAEQAVNEVTGMYDGKRSIGRAEYAGDNIYTITYDHR